MSKPAILEVKNLTIAFKTKAGPKVAVRAINFKIFKGETYALLGESGCGKSLTALSIMQLLPAQAVLARPTEIFLEKIKISTLSEIQMRPLRGHKIAMIFQEPMTSLNPVLTVSQQIAEVLRLHTTLKGKAIKNRIIELLEEVQLTDARNLLRAYPHQLSGGMKQRVMIAMALAGEPELLIADEATSALDVTVQKQILNLLKSLQQKRDMSILMITHDLSVVKTMADRVGVMYAGYMIEEAPCEAFFHQPLHPYTQGLFASVPSLATHHLKLSHIAGIVPPLTSHFSGCRFAARCFAAREICRGEEPEYQEALREHIVRCFQYSKPECFSGINPGIEPEALPKRAMRSEHEVLSIKNLKCFYPIKKGILKRTVGYVEAVNDVTLNLLKGETLAIVGESGCGKSTLAKTILHLLLPFSGSIEVGIQDKKVVPGNNRQFRTAVQIIFQDPQASMNPRMLVGDIIAEGMRSLDLMPEEQIQKKLIELVSQVGLNEEALGRYPHEFSGGQRQRICIARALAVEPEIIICDEPTSALDVSIQSQILNLLKKLQFEKQLSYLFISHNMAVVAYMADHIAVMQRGKIVEYNEAKNILLNPQHPYTQELMNAVLTV